MNQATPKGIINLDRVSVYHGKTKVLDDISLPLMSSETLVILGQNGAGKSTLLRTLLGRTKIKSGERKVSNRIFEYSAGAIFGYASQTPSLNKDLTVDQNIKLYASLKGWKRKTKKAEVKRVTQLLRLSSFSDRRVGRISGGQQQRVHLAIALLGHPAVLILDEPLKGVDSDSRDVMGYVLSELVNSGTSVVMSTHDPSDVLDKNASVLVLDKGKSLVLKKASDLISEYGSHSIDVCFDKAPKAGSLIDFGYMVGVQGRVLRMSGSSNEEVTSRLVSLNKRLSSSAVDRILSIETKSPSLDQAYKKILDGS